MKLKLLEKRPIAQDTIMFIFEPEQPLTWKAGQYLRYQLPDPSPDERGQSRFFSLTSAPFEKNIFLTTKFVPGDGSTFKRDLQKLAVGDEIEGFGPGGSFTLETLEKEYVFIAGGIGITPFRSIILDLNSQKKPINITLMYANKTAEAPFKNELAEVAASHPEFKIKYYIGGIKIDEQAIKDTISDLSKPYFYISGPEPMVQSFEKLLSEMGVPEEHIKRDYFPGYKVI